MRRLEIAFLMPDQKYTYLNSTLVKEVARHGGAITGLVPPLVERKLRERLRSQARATRGPAAKRR
jgi:pantetheine-phosphate adenylyltransferase